MTGHAQHTFAATPEQAEQAGVEFGDVTSLGLETEIAMSNTFALLLQTEWETSALRDLDFPRASDPQWLIWGGLRAHLTPRITLDVGLGEDLSGFTSPDVSFYLAMAFDLGGPDP